MFCLVIPRLAPTVERMRRSLGALRGFCSSSTQENTKLLAMLSSVVKLKCTRLLPLDPANPTSLLERIGVANSSCFIIAGRKLLTAAHCIENHLAVTVQRRGCKDKFPARVLAEGRDCDLALLSVESNEFWEGAAAPLKFGHIPLLKDAVTVIGYPGGGFDISVTRGIVSRIEVTSYGHGLCDLMSIQVDAAANNGNSGGVAVNDAGEIVGVTFMSLAHAQNVCQNMNHLIPMWVVSHFLMDYDRNGKYTGFPHLSAFVEELDNHACECSGYLRDHLDKGVRVVEVSRTLLVLQEGDIILSIDGIYISDVHMAGERSIDLVKNLIHLLSQRFVGDIAQIGIIRQGRFMDVLITLEAEEGDRSLRILRRQMKHKLRKLLYELIG